MCVAFSSLKSKYGTYLENHVDKRLEWLNLNSNQLGKIKIIQVEHKLESESKRSKTKLQTQQKTETCVPLS